MRRSERRDVDSGERSNVDISSTVALVFPMHGAAVFFSYRFSCILCILNAILSQLQNFELRTTPLRSEPALAAIYRAPPTGRPRFPRVRTRG